MGLGFHGQHAVVRQERCGIFCRFWILLFDEPAGYDHAALATPSAQSHFALDALKSLTAIHPSALPFHQGNEVFDLHGLPDLKKIGDVSFFAREHIGLAPVATVPTNALRAAFDGQGVDQLPQRRHSIR